MLHSITTRPSSPADLEFLASLYASTREDLIQAGFPVAQREAFCQMQFRARQQHYASHYPNAQDHILLYEGVAVGREWIDREGPIWCLVDIALLPAYRNIGIGSARLRELIDQSDRAGRDVTLHAERMGAAHRLYARLGFAIVGDDGVYLAMRRNATSR